MFKIIRAAGLTAAAALLCAANGATAQDLAASPLSSAAAFAPVSPISIEAPAAAEVPATAQPARVVEAHIADASPSHGRARPDRQVEAAAAPIRAVMTVSTTGRTRASLGDLVAQHTAAEITDSEFECLASAVYFESRGEPLEGQLAVAEVILNRVRSGRFRSTVCDVVKQPSQFSFVRRGVIPAAPRQSAAWQRAVAIAHIALNDLHDVTGEDSLFFHATYVNPRWGRPRITRIGNHIFYR